MSILRTFTGEPATPEHWHAGLMPDDEHQRRPNGYPVYRPRDPVSIRQTEYVRFAGERGPNSD